jgi:hypothetical protein
VEDITDKAFKKLDGNFRRAKGNDFSVDTWVVYDFSTIDTYCFLTISHNEKYDESSAFNLTLYVEDSGGEYSCRLGFQFAKYIEKLIDVAKNDNDTLSSLRKNVGYCKEILKDDASVALSFAKARKIAGEEKFSSEHRSEYYRLIQCIGDCEEILTVLGFFQHLTNEGI